MTAITPVNDSATELTLKGANLSVLPSSVIFKSVLTGVEVPATTVSTVTDSLLAVGKPAIGHGEIFEIRVTLPGETAPSGVLSRGYITRFLDADWDAHPEDRKDLILTMAKNQIAKGYGNGTFLINTMVARQEFIVMLTRALNGSKVQNPAADGTCFSDVPSSLALAPFIERLAREPAPIAFDCVTFTTGCQNPPRPFCPTAQLTRKEMAKLILLAKGGVGYVPPPPVGYFADLPVSDPWAPWAEELYRQGITSGCVPQPLQFCPNAGVTRSDASVLISRAFHLQCTDLEGCR